MTLGATEAAWSAAHRRCDTPRDTCWDPDASGRPQFEPCGLLNGRIASITRLWPDSVSRLTAMAELVQLLPADHRELTAVMVDGDTVEAMYDSPNLNAIFGPGVVEMFLTSTSPTVVDDTRITTGYLRWRTA